ncbi:MAG: 50S ribosomal protein L18 [Alphaproteobacteria bacterium]|nr:MAG: 50S ribosomal protein L18 [Alphaproteobacteria bacterium]
MATKKLELFRKRAMRVRRQLKKVARGKPRLSVHRSTRNISAQIIDDSRGVTLAAASTLEPALGLRSKKSVEAAARIGAEIAARARAAGVEEVVFDRGGYLYHGRLKALADAAREGGLKF